MVKTPSRFTPAGFISLLRGLLFLPALWTEKNRVWVESTPTETEFGQIFLTEWVI
jgi:hypothetical protein